MVIDRSTTVQYAHTWADSANLHANTEQEAGVWTYHPDFLAAEPHLQLAKDAYESGGGFLDGSNLVQFSVREHDDRYTARKEVAYFVSWLRTLVSIPATYIVTAGIHRDFSRLPIDPTKPPFGVQSIYGNWADSLKYLMIQASLYGVVIGGLDRAASPSETLEDDILNPPRLLVLPPLMVPDWDVVGNRFDWIKHIEPRKNGRGDPFNPQDAVSNIRIWTENEWYLYSKGKDENGNEIDVLEGRGDNTYGRVPLIPLRSAPAQSGLYGPKESWQAARVNKRAYNQMSEADDQLRNSAFSILTVPTEGGEAVDITVGSSTMLPYDPNESGPPTFISPSSEPVNLCFEALDRLRRYGYDIMRLGAVDRGTKPATAVQKLFESEETNKVVRDLAYQAEAFERDLLRLFLAVSGYNAEAYEDIISSPDTLRYPENYNLDILSDNRVDRAVKTLTIKWPSQTANKEFAKHYGTTLIPMSNDIKTKIKQEIEASEDAITFLGQGEGQERLQKPMTDHNDVSPDTGGQ